MITAQNIKIANCKLSNNTIYRNYFVNYFIYQYLFLFLYFTQELLNDFLKSQSSRISILTTQA